MRRSHAKCDHPRTPYGRMICRVGKGNMPRDYRINGHYRRTFGGSLEQFNKLYDKQKGLCAICDRELTRETKHASHGACWDHCHKQLKPRGILCRRCNIQLGWFEKFAPRIIKYLEKYEEIKG